MRARSSLAPLSDWLERWMNWLPVYEDREESANCYSFIGQILTAQNDQELALNRTLNNSTDSIIFIFL